MHYLREEAKKLIEMKNYAHGSNGDANGGGFETM
jgi:hypothetical protein